MKGSITTRSSRDFKKFSTFCLFGKLTAGLKFMSTTAFMSDSRRASVTVLPSHVGGKKPHSFSSSLAVSSVMGPLGNTLGLIISPDPCTLVCPLYTRRPAPSKPTLPVSRARLIRLRTALGPPVWVSPRPQEKMTGFCDISLANSRIAD